MTYTKDNIEFLPLPTSPQFKDLTGLLFNRLTAQGIVEYRLNSRGKRIAVWLCRCVCGNEVRVTRSNLVSGGVQSCGCLRDDRLRAVLTTHGFSNHPLYTIWDGIRRRCNDPGDRAYKNYGARGIQMCERWRDIQNFIDDMGERPSLKHTVERVDNEGHYSPDNCIWATRKEQNRNKRDTILVTYDGRTQCLTDWAAEIRSNTPTLRYRLRVGWSIKQALTTVPHHTERFKNKHKTS